MKTIEIYDSQSFLGSVGCGASADRDKFRLATMIRALSRDGQNIKQFGLTENPEAFTENQIVQAALAADDHNILPLTLVDGQIKQKGTYPTNQQLASWLEISKDQLVKLLMKEKMASRSFCGGDCC
ncbi:MAG: arsenic metallochaperone ArsD family protein [Eubacteriaceae bacterium]